MEPARILEELVQGGIFLEVVGDKIRLRPPEKVKPDLVAMVSQNKPALLSLLRDREAFEERVVVACDAAGRAAPDRWLQEVDRAHRALDLRRLEVLAVRFERWSRRELRGDEPPWATMRAGNLGGAEVVVVLDEAVCLPPELERMATYTTAEVRRLVGVDPRVLRAVHLVKDCWPEARVVRNGEIRDEEPAR